MKFSKFNFSPPVMKGIEKAGFEECMPVQEQVFKTALENRRDVTVQSQTGTGKTAAFLLTIFETFAREPEKKHRALIIAPTRELAVQIDEEARLLGSGLGVKTGCFYGGAGYAVQEKALKEGVDIAIGTPGRLIDFINSGKLSILDIDTLVIDEADRLFDMGFYPDLKKILKKMIKPEKRQTMLFSATMSQRVAHLAWEFMNDPLEIEIDPERITVDEIEQVLYHVSSEEKFRLLLGILAAQKPANAIIFTNTKDMTVRLARRLSINGYHAEYIMGDLPQKQRLKIIDSIKKGELEILVATDVAARGLHIDDLDMVINYDIPEDPENYVHRIGRTARAGKSGKAVTLACEKFVFGLEAVEEFIGRKIPVEWANQELLDTEDKSASMRISGLERNTRARSSQGGRGPARKERFSGDSRGSGHESTGRRSSGSGSRETGRKQNAGRKNGSPTGSPEKTGKRRERQAPLHAASASQSDSRVDRSDVRPDIRAAKQGDLESRLEYYRQKYGEDFQLKESTEKNVSGDVSLGKKKSPTKKSRPAEGGFLKRFFHRGD
jgi:ATP-dependent RNA helicase RhlB